MDSEAKGMSGGVCEAYVAFLPRKYNERQGKTDSEANAMSGGVCEAYVDIPEISKIDISYIIKKRRNCHRQFRRFFIIWQEK